MRSSTPLLLVGLLVVAALAAGALAAGAPVTQEAVQEAGNGTTPTATATPGGSDARTTISATGSGEVTAEPDEVVVHVAASATADTPGVAADRLARNASRLRTALTNATAEERVQSTDYSLFERRDRNGTVYVASQSFEVTLSNTSDAGRIVDVATANGATEVLGVRFTLSDERRRTLRQQAIELAVTDARAQADAAASSAGLTVSGVRSITVHDGGATPFVERAAADGTQIDPRPVMVTARVDVTYDATAT